MPSRCGCNAHTEAMAPFEIWTCDLAVPKVRKNKHAAANSWGVRYHVYNVGHSFAGMHKPKQGQLAQELRRSDPTANSIILDGPATMNLL